MERRYVGIDLHRRRSVIVTMDEAGEVLSSVRIPNDPIAMSLAVAEAGEGAEVAFEATYGWYWLADLLQGDGHHLHLAHPLAMRGMTSKRRVKTDWKDATLLAGVEVGHHPRTVLPSAGRSGDTPWSPPLRRRIAIPTIDRPNRW